jgi:hypothetical protein
MNELFGCSLIINIIYDYSSIVGKFKLSNLNHSARKILSSKPELSILRSILDLDPNNNINPYYKCFKGYFPNGTFSHISSLFIMNKYYEGHLYYNTFDCLNQSLVIHHSNYGVNFEPHLVEIWMHYVANPNEQILFGTPWWSDPQYLMHHTPGDIWKVYVPISFLLISTRLQYHIRSHIYRGFKHIYGCTRVPFPSSSYFRDYDSHDGVVDGMENYCHCRINNHGYVENGARESGYLKIPSDIKPYSSIHLPFM